MEKLLIATLIIASAAAVFGIASLLLILLKKDKNPANSNPIDVRNIENKQIENTADIKAAINNLEKNISLKMEGQIDSKMQGQITEIVKTMKDQSDWNLQGFYPFLIKSTIKMLCRKRPQLKR